MELEEPTATVKQPPDARPTMPEPPPVRLLAIADVHLEAPAAMERLLSDFYVGLLRFERDAEDAERLAFKAEKWRLVFDVVESFGPRDGYRPVMIETPFFADFVQALNDRELFFEWQKGTAAGVETVFLQDPAGYWISVGPVRAIS